MAKLNLKIVTPQGKFFECEDIDSLSIETSAGQITILSGHLPIITRVVSGELIYRKNGKDSFLMVADGFLKLGKSGDISILCDYAAMAADIEEAKVVEAKKRASEALKEVKSGSDFAIAEAQLRRALAELKVVRKKHE